jgi:hypothetical protein
VRAWRGPSRDGERDDALTEVREATRGLVVGAVVVAALVLLAWPQRGARVYATTVALLVVYCATLIMLASDAPWAVSLRQRVRRLWSERPAGATEATGARAWLAREMRVLQLGGVILGALVLMFWPGLTLGSFIIIVALMLLWVGSIEYSVGSA